MRQPNPKPAMNKQLSFWAVCGVACCLCVNTSCSHLHISQDEVVGPDGKVTGRHTDFSARTFFDSKSELSKSSSTMTDKTQGIRVSGLTQEASSTGTVQVLKIIVEGARTVGAGALVP